MADEAVARNAFRGMGRNFMTPYVIGYGDGRLKDGTQVAWELSTGTGVFSDGPIYGVTFLVADEGGWWTEAWRENRDDLSRMFRGEAEARAYIAETVR